MSRLTQSLSLLLGLQLLVTAAVFWPREDAGDRDARSAILDLAIDRIDRIEVSDSNGSVVLSHTDSGWVLPDYFSLPVSASRLDTVLQTLPAKTRGWPVARSSGALERFEVSESNFQRRIRYRAGEDLAGELYLGSSPGFRKVHSRPGDDESVYAIEFSSYEVPASDAEWLEKTLLQLDADISEITGLDYHIEAAGDDSWKNADGVTAEASVVSRLINGLASLRVTAVADAATTETLAQMDVPPTLSVATGSGRLEYRLFEMDDAHYVQRSDRPVFFSISEERR